MNPLAKDKLFFNADLPSEIASEIVKKVDSLRDLCRLSCLSKDWSELANKDIYWQPFMKSILGKASGINLIPGLPLKLQLKERLHAFWEAFYQGKHFLINIMDSQEIEMQALKDLEALHKSIRPLEEKILDVKNYLSNAKNNPISYLISNYENNPLKSDLLKTALQVGVEPNIGNLFSAINNHNKAAVQQIMLFGNKQELEEAIKVFKGMFSPEHLSKLGLASINIF